MEKAIKETKAVDVSVEKVSKSFGQQVVLKEITFNVAQSETFVIMGPSGSGKSVLLKQIIGLSKPDTGKVLINNLNASESETHRKIVTSIVFQAGALFNSLTVFDNLALYPREHRLYPKNILNDKVKYTLSMLSLENATKKYPSELSGGMRKRVAIARALMMEPQLLLYDEPTSELDPIMASTISEIIATLNDRFHVTSIVVSHDKELALNIANRVAFLFNGKLEVIAKPSDLHHINNIRVQEFLNPKIDIKNPRFKRLETL